MKMFIDAKLNTYDPSKVAGFFYLKFLRESCPYLHVIKFQKGRKVVLSLWNYLNLKVFKLSELLQKPTGSRVLSTCHHYPCLMFSTTHVLKLLLWKL